MAESESGRIWYRKIKGKIKKLSTDNHGGFLLEAFLYFINEAWICVRILVQK